MPLKTIRLSSYDDLLHPECMRRSDEWQLTDGSVESTTISDTSALILTIHLQRLPGYYIMNVALPILLLSVVGMLVFVSPAEAQEKSVLVVTIQACFIALLLLVQEITPHVPGTTPLLGIFVMSSCYFKLS